MEIVKKPLSLNVILTEKECEYLYDILKVDTNNEEEAEFTNKLMSAIEKEVFWQRKYKEEKRKPTHPLHIQKKSKKF